MIRHLDHLTGEGKRAEPWLWIDRAWLAAYTGQFAACSAALQNAETEMDKVKEQDHRQTLRGHCAAIRAYNAWVLGEREVAIQAAKEVLDYLPASELTIRCQSATILGLSFDDVDEREQAYIMALEYAQGASVAHVVIFAYGGQAYLFLLQGKLHKAYATCKEAIHIANVCIKRASLGME